MTDNLTDMAALYAQMYRQRQEIEDQLKAHKQAMADLEKQIIDQFFEAGVTQIRVNGDLVHTRSRIFASCPDPAQLAVTEWGWMVKDAVNANTLSAQVRELSVDDEGNPILPEDIPEGCVNVYKEWKLGVRKS